MNDPFRGLTTTNAIKKAYRKLCMSCHPDLRTDKDRATEEFRELTSIYEVALSMVGTIKPSKPKKEPPAPPPKPSQPIFHRTVVASLESFEFLLFGEVSRAARAPPEIFEYGGTVRIILSKYNNEANFEFIVPPKTPNGQKFRFKLPIGQVEITLVSERK